MKKIIHWMIAATVVGALAGCARTAPIEQVNAIVSAGHTEAQVKDAIIKAGAQRQWIMSDAGPGVIKGKLQNRDHVADIKINYSATSYSIVYVSSINLMAANGKSIETITAGYTTSIKIFRLRWQQTPLCNNKYTYGSLLTRFADYL